MTEEDDTLPGCVARDKMWFLDIGCRLGNMASEEYRKLDNSGRLHLIMWASVSLWWCGRNLALLYALFTEKDQDDTLPRISLQVARCQSSTNRVWRETVTAFLTLRFCFDAMCNVWLLLFRTHVSIFICFVELLSLHTVELPSLNNNRMMREKIIWT